MVIYVEPGISGHQLHEPRLTVGIGHPRGLGEHEVLQFLVLLQLTVQGSFASLLPLPLLEHGLGLRHLVDDVLADAVGIERSTLADGAVVVGMANSGQSLNHQPGGVVGIFKGQLGILRVGSHQLRQVDGFRARLVLSERIGHGDALTIWQYGQVVLLAVAELVGRGHHLADEQRIVNCQL